MQMPFREPIFENVRMSGLIPIIRPDTNNYLPLADTALIIDNSIAELNKIIARKDVANGLKIEETSIWKEIERIAHGTQA